MLSQSRMHALAALVAVLFALESQFAASLGFYEDDFQKAWLILKASNEGVVRQAADALLTDEPLFQLYHVLRFRLLGFEHPGWHHVLPGALHAANIFLLYWLAQLWTRSASIAFSAAVLFAVFPGLGQAEYWTAAIYPALLTLLAVAMIAWLLRLRSGRRGALAAAFAFYAAAVFTHEMAFGALAPFVAVWAWERRKHWKRHWTEIAPFVAASLTYLLVRQTNWFGWSVFTMEPHRELAAGRIPELAFASFNLGFGPWFWSRTEQLAAAASAGDAWRAWIALAGLGAAAWMGASGKRGRMLLAFAATTGAGLALAHLFGIATFLRWSYLAVVCVALYAVATRESKPALLAGALGLLWFAAVFSPAWAFYIAYRHAYIPAAGVALALAGACHTVGYSGLLRGVQWGVVGCFCALFHRAQMGELQAWMRYHRDIESVRFALQAITPPISSEQRVVLLGVPQIRDEHPIFTELAVQPAVRLWLHDNQVRAALEASEPYEALRVFQLSSGSVREAGMLTLPDGTRIALPHGDPSIAVAAPD